MCKDTYRFKQMNSTANSESTNLWRNSLIMLGLFTAHVIINHRLVSLGVAPVGTDPCDGVNAYAFITVAFIAIGSTLRMFSGHHSSSPLRYLYIVRSQLAVLFAIFITFAAEIIALIRNPETWIRNRFADSVFALLGALPVVTVHTSADPGYTTKQDIAELIAMDTHDITCRDRHRCPHCLSGMANLQFLKNRAHPHRCSRSAGGLHPDAPFTAPDRAEWIRCPS
jgi:hypothetical protein